VDSFLEKCHTLPIDPSFQLLGAAAISIAFKVEYLYEISYAQITEWADYCFTVKDLVSAERLLLLFLDWKVLSKTKEDS